MGERETYCPCGYRIECPFWCGEGHLNGMCPSEENKDG